MDPIVNLLNALLTKSLPAINRALQLAIVQNHLDPWISVKSGSETLGSIDLGICTAAARASYSVSNLQGLASFSISSLQITKAAPVPGGSGKVSGNISLAAGLGAMRANLGGSVKAGCGFISDTVGIGGSITIGGASVSSGGDFVATTQGSSIVIEHLDVEQLDVNYQNLKANINGLGIFNGLLHPLEDLILDQVKGPIRSLIANAITPAINQQLARLLPLSTQV